MGWLRGGQDPSTSSGGIFNPERRRERRAARQAGDVQGWRQGRWLERKGLGEVGWDESGYAEPLEEEYRLLQEDLNRIMAERAGGYGVQAAMTGGRESSTFQQQLGDLGSRKMEAFAQGRSSINAQRSAWEQAEEERTGGEIAARNARRAGLAGGALQGIGAGLQLIPGVGTVAGLGLMGIGGAVSGAGKGQAGEAQSYEDEYMRLMQMLREREGDLDELRDIYGESQWGGY
jgi:hypothetical protein